MTYFLNRLLDTATAQLPSSVYRRCSDGEYGPPPAPAQCPLSGHFETTRANAQAGAKTHKDTYKQRTSEVIGRGLGGASQVHARYKHGTSHTGVKVEGRMMNDEWPSQADQSHHRARSDSGFGTRY